MNSSPTLSWLIRMVFDRLFCELGLEKILFYISYTCSVYCIFYMTAILIEYRMCFFYFMMYS